MLASLATSNSMAVIFATMYARRYAAIPANRNSRRVRMPIAIHCSELFNLERRVIARHSDAKPDKRQQWIR